MSWGPLIHGHAPKGLVKALGRGGARHELRRADRARDPARANAWRRSCRRSSGVRFVSSGTEAAMSAVRVARAFTKRDKIIKFEGCYHGHADAFLVQAGSGAMTLGVPTSPGVAGGRRARHAARAVQRPGLGRARCSMHNREADRRGLRRADRRQHGRGAAAPTASWRAFATICDRGAARCWFSTR